MPVFIVRGVSALSSLLPTVHKTKEGAEQHAALLVNILLGEAEMTRDATPRNWNLRLNLLQIEREWEESCNVWIEEAEFRE